MRQKIIAALEWAGIWLAVSSLWIAAAIAITSAAPGVYL